MAEAASSSAPSQSRSLFSASSSDSNPASPRTPSICKESGGRLDSTAEECCCATSAPHSPFAQAAGEKERSLSREYDAARSLIERWDDGWFRENVVSCRWGQSSPTSSKVVDGYGAAARDRLVEDSASSQGIRAPDAAGLSASQREPFRSIEMVPPLVTSRSFSAGTNTRESRDLPLPSTRLRRLTRRPGSMGDVDTSFLDIEQKQFSAASMDDTFHRFGEMQIEPSRLGPVRRSKKREDDVNPSRPFSDGDERPEEVNARLSDVFEEGESASEDKPPKKNQVSRQLVLPAKLAPIVSGEELRNPLTDRNISKPPPQRPRKRRDHRRRSKSTTDGEFDEMRGCEDLGFKINEDELTPRLHSGLKVGDDLFDSPRGLASPKGWPRRPDSPLFRWQIPAVNGSNNDMRENLKQWAHYVASTVVSAEC